MLQHPLKIRKIRKREKCPGEKSWSQNYGVQKITYLFFSNQHDLNTCQQKIFKNIFSFLFLDIFKNVQKCNPKYFFIHNFFNNN